MTVQIEHGGKLAPIGSPHRYQGFVGSVLRDNRGRLVSRFTLALGFPTNDATQAASDGNWLRLNLWEPHNEEN